MYEIKKRFQDEAEVKWLSLTDREEKYIQSRSFPKRQLEAAIESANSTEDDVVDIVAKDFKNYASGDREIIYEERAASYGHFPVAVASFDKLLEDRYDRIVRDKKPSGTYFTLEEPISPLCFLPSQLSTEPVIRLEQLYVALTALRKVWQSYPSYKETYLEVELERKFFKYFFREQFESPKPNVKVQEFSYTPLPGQFQFRVQYIYL